MRTATLVSFLFLASLARPITIVSHEVNAGGTLPFGQAVGSAPNHAGNGSLSVAVNAASDYWESYIGDNFTTVDIAYGWTNMNGQFLGMYDYAGFGGTILEAQIQFDNSGTLPWFFDSTPTDSSEFQGYTEYKQDLGGGLMIVGEEAVALPGPAAGSYDLYTVALHEIGRALGIVSGDNWSLETSDGDIDITGPRRFAGAHIPITGVSLNLAHDVMYPSLGVGQRRAISEADIDSVMQLNNWSHYNTVPEPSGFLVLIPALVCLFYKKRC